MYDFDAAAARVVIKMMRRPACSGSSPTTQISLHSGSPGPEMSFFGFARNMISVRISDSGFCWISKSPGRWFLVMPSVSKSLPNILISKGKSRLPCSSRISLSSSASRMFKSGFVVTVRLRGNCNNSSIVAGFGSSATTATGPPLPEYVNNNSLPANRL